MKNMLITGGAGFIGSNAAVYFAKRGWNIFILDNLSRKGSELNLTKLQEEIDFEFFQGDIRFPDSIETWFCQVGQVDAILHMASQVAVTTSIQDPRTDFEVNALGTLNILEAMRLQTPETKLIFASTNKVYGALEDRQVTLKGTQYDFADIPNGICEQESLDFHSPYGCSKGAADQYVRDYARVYGLNTTVVRQSCVYGTRQYGVEDQGWVAWFAIAALTNQPITIYGDGKQTRDLLWIDDLLNLYDACLAKTQPGVIYNAGGGAKHRASLLEAIQILEEVLGRPIPYTFSESRPGDQRAFYSDNTTASDKLDWTPQVSIREGVERLVNWLQQHQKQIEELLTA